MDKEVAERWAENAAADLAKRVSQTQDQPPTEAENGPDPDHDELRTVLDTAIEEGMFPLGKHPHG